MKLLETCTMSKAIAKLKDAPIVPVCTAAAIGLLSGAVLGFVFSPIKHGIVIGSYNTTVSDEKNDKNRKCKNAEKRKVNKRHQRNMEHYILADES